MLRIFVAITWEAVMKERNFNLIIFLFLLAVLFLLSLHLLDIGDIICEGWGRDARGCNGVWCINCVLLYHLGMYGMLACFLVLLFVVLKILCCG